LEEEETSVQLRQIEAALVRLDRRMRTLCAGLPAPEFEADTDRPLNASAEIYGLLSATLEDEISSAVLALRRALTISGQMEAKEPKVPV
jgi:hypothetical protein